MTVNRLCASGLEAVVQGARQIRLGEAELVLAGGVESMSRAPLVMLKPERGFPRGNGELVDTTIGWRFVNPRLAERHSTESMGETAENVAERYGVSREDQDAFALESHRRARRRRRGRPLRRRDRDRRRAPAEGRPGDDPRRRGPAPRHQPRAPRPAQADLPRGRQRDRRERVADQRRRGLRRGGERGARPRAGPRAAGADREQRLGRRRPGRHGHRPRPVHRARRSSAPASSRRTSTWWS